MTPEDKEATMSEAVEAMKAHRPYALYRPIPGGAMTAMTEWIGNGCTCGWRPEGIRTDEFVVHQLRALLEPRVTPCETCGGTGFDRDNPNDVQSCPDCFGGQVTRPSLAVLRGERVAWERDGIVKAAADMLVRDNGFGYPKGGPEVYGWVPLYRDASKGAESD